LAPLIALTSLSLENNDEATNEGVMALAPLSLSLNGCDKVNGEGARALTPFLVIVCEIKFYCLRI
jgi:hypothetical protein